MTLDETIVHEKELAEKNYMQGMLCHANPDDEKLDGYIESGRYHEQVAEWLEDYKHIKQWKSDIMEDFCRYDVSSFEELVINVRNKAIDDFINQFNVIVDEKCGTDTNNYFRKIVKEIAEQLKAGVEHEYR